MEGFWKLYVVHFIHYVFMYVGVMLNLFLTFEVHDEHSWKPKVDQILKTRLYMMWLLLSHCVFFIQQEFSMSLKNIVEEGKEDTLSSHEREEVCKIHPLISCVNFFLKFQQSRLTLVWFSRIKCWGRGVRAQDSRLYRRGIKLTKTL